MLLALIVALQFFIVPTTLTVCLRGGAISLGVLIALWQKHSSYFLFEPVPLADENFVRLAIVSIPLLFMAMLASDAASIVQFPLALIAGLSGFLVWLASYNGNYVWQEGIMKRVLLWIAARSYALYLIHQPVYLSMHEIWFRTHRAGVYPSGLDTLAYILTVYVVLFCLADINYRFLEVPLRQHGTLIALRFGS